MHNIDSLGILTRRSPRDEAIGDLDKVFAKHGKEMIAIIEKLK